MVSSVLMKLGARTTEAAVLVAGPLRQPDDSNYGGYRLSLFPELVAEVTAALLNSTSEAGTVPPTDSGRAKDAARLADALPATRTGPTISQVEQTARR